MGSAIQKCTSSLFHLYPKKIPVSECGIRKGRKPSCRAEHGTRWSSLAGRWPGMGKHVVKKKDGYYSCEIQTGGWPISLRVIPSGRPNCFSAQLFSLNSSAKNCSQSFLQEKNTILFYKKGKHRPQIPSPLSLVFWFFVFVFVFVFSPQSCLPHASPSRATCLPGKTTVSHAQLYRKVSFLS